MRVDLRLQCFQFGFFPHFFLIIAFCQLNLHRQKMRQSIGQANIELDENGNYLVPETGAEEYEEFFGTEQDMTFDLHLKDGTTLAGFDFWAIDDDDPGVLATAE